MDRSQELTAIYEDMELKFDLASVRMMQFKAFWRKVVANRESRGNRRSFSVSSERNMSKVQDSSNIVDPALEEVLKLQMGGDENISFGDNNGDIVFSC
jgi:hypothetical protein